MIDLKMFVSYFLLFIYLFVTVNAAGNGRCLREDADRLMDTYKLAPDVGEPKLYGKTYLKKKITCILCNDALSDISPEILQGGYGCNKVDLRIAINRAPGVCLVYGRSLNPGEGLNCV